MTVASGFACPTSVEGGFVAPLGVYLNGNGIMQVCVCSHPCQPQTPPPPPPHTPVVLLSSLLVPNQHIVNDNGAETGWPDAQHVAYIC